MAGLERLRLSTKRSEASSLLAVESAGASALGADGAWWVCHDEGDLDEMISLVVANGDEWSVTSIEFDRGSTERTDAEALARLGDTVFVFGSSFIGKSGALDERRAFVGRFSEAAALSGFAAIEVLDLGSALVDMASVPLAATERLRSDAERDLINVEGAGFLNGDLLLGLRWPVSADGQPLLLRIADAARVLQTAGWSVESFASLDCSVVEVAVGASPKRPAGIRGMAVVDGAVHLMIGQTERGLAAKKVKAAGARHVQIDTLGPGLSSVTEVEKFEGFRKVEGLAPTAAGGWVYALDDEDAVVLILSAAP